MMAKWIECLIIYVLAYTGVALVNSDLLWVTSVDEWPDALRFFLFLGFWAIPIYSFWKENW